jgi:hypothetical protein
VPDIGNSVYGEDTPPSTFDQDWTLILNLSSTSYAASQSGVGEVGTAFVAPTSGRVLIIVGGGVRNNAATQDRAIITYRVYEDSAAGNQIVFAAADNGIISCGVASSQEFQYQCTYDMQSGLTPGRQYYVQIAYRTTGGNTADIASRQVTVVPLP